MAGTSEKATPVSSLDGVPLRSLCSATRAEFDGLSLRQYERRFVTEIGFTPKLFSRIARFQTTLDTKRISPQRSWMSVAHELGYFDQMHMVHDFRCLGGNAPSDLFQQIGDYQPWSLASPSKPF